MLGTRPIEYSSFISWYVTQAGESSKGPHQGLEAARLSPFRPPLPSDSLFVPRITLPSTMRGFPPLAFYDGKLSARRFRNHQASDQYCKGAHQAHHYS